MSEKNQILFIVMHQSIPSTNIPPPRADPRGNFLKWPKTLPQGKIFLQKHSPRDMKIPTPREYCERSSQLFLLVSVEILEFSRNQTLKRTGKLFKSSFSFSLSTILKVLKFPPSFQTEFVTREQQRDGTSV